MFPGEPFANHISGTILILLMFAAPALGVGVICQFIIYYHLSKRGLHTAALSIWLSYPLLIVFAFGWMIYFPG